MELKKERIKNEIISSNDRINVFNKLPNKEKASVLMELPANIRKKIISKTKNSQIVKFLKFLDYDEATDVLQVIDKKRRKEIISKIEKGAREKIQRLLKFSPEVAGGLMNLDYIQTDIDSKLKHVLDSAHKHEKITGKFPTIIVTKKGLFHGELPAYNLQKIKKNESIKNYIQKIPTVMYNINSKKTGEIFKKYSHNKIAVIDKENIFLGIIYAHDVLKLMDESNSFSAAAGVSKEEDVHDKFTSKVKHRYRWLILNLFTAFLAASVVTLFEDTLTKFILLAAYMPVVAGMGGNAGSQALAVFVRGITLKEIEFNKKAIKPVLNEVLAGMANGAIVGVLAAGIAMILDGSPILGIIIALAMIFNLIIAGFFGAIIPLFMKKIGKDPATSATIFITTATDILGFFFFLGLASILL